jgi:hypothetical protein
MKRLHVLTLIGLLAYSTNGYSEVQENRPCVIESKNYPEHFITSKDYVCAIEMVENQEKLRHCKFKTVPGLADSKCVSIESADFPGYFLRHQDYLIKLHKNDGSEQFKQDATFKKQKGLADPEYVSFESFNFPEHYIRHKCLILWINKQDNSDLFKMDATFKMDDPNKAIPPKFSK